MHAVVWLLLFYQASLVGTIVCHIRKNIYIKSIIFVLCYIKFNVYSGVNLRLTMMDFMNAAAASAEYCCHSLRLRPSL